MIVVASHFRESRYFWSMLIAVRLAFNLFFLLVCYVCAHKARAARLSLHCLCLWLVVDEIIQRTFMQIFRPSQITNELLTLEKKTEPKWESMRDRVSIQ